MFFRELENGKYRYYEKYFDLEENKWKQVSITLTSKTRQAQKQARILLDEKIEKKRENIEKEKTEVRKITVKEAYEEYLKIRKSELKRSTFKSQKYTIIGEIRKLEDYLLMNVTSRIVQNILLELPCSAEHRKNKKVLLNLFFKYCLNVGYISENPIDNVVLPKRKKNLKKVRKKQNKYLTRAEVVQYLNFLEKEEKNQRVRLIVEFMYLTGLRFGEVLALTLEDIDFGNKTLEVKHTLHTSGSKAEIFLDSPKSLASYRVIGISDRVLEIIEEYLLIEKEGRFIFTKNGNPFMIFSFNDFLKRSFKRSGIQKEEDFVLTTHVFRHSHISLLAELEVPIKAIMERVGHTNEKMTLGVYTHVTEQMKFNITEKLDKLDL
ncbi:MAG: site-specific integrase [Streptococcus oralis]|jgi:putative integrase|uniref:tyrosine-type recombinase/integrase n=1 Tax=Streptococcus sp. GP0011 TaxID=3063751 RepID=UPI0026E33554|nr:site-specific integrase [Streptococcus sp. GP0011]MDO6346600.1 site-specific integrase [Streptococcus sp. GP0011]MDU3460066.1 site-specific integrase [Streptococcus oralis]